LGILDCGLGEEAGSEDGPLTCSCCALASSPRCTSLRGARVQTREADVGVVGTGSAAGSCGAERGGRVGRKGTLPPPPPTAAPPPDGGGSGRAACWPVCEAGLARSEYMIGNSMAYGYQLVKWVVWNVEGCGKVRWGLELGAEEGARGCVPRRAEAVGSIMDSTAKSTGPAQSSGTRGTSNQEQIQPCHPPCLAACDTLRHSVLVLLAALSLGSWHGGRR
jgi:hypothetical protein